jgi:hypothetical protein
MAFMSQEKKAQIAAVLKTVIPKGWKYSVGVDNHTTIILNIWAAPVDLLKIAGMVGKYQTQYGYAQLGVHALGRDFAGSEVGEIFAKIQAALFGASYFDKTDTMTDFHHCAYYVNVNLGRYDKPFKFVQAEIVA